MNQALASETTTITMSSATYNTLVDTLVDTLATDTIAQTIRPPTPPTPEEILNTTEKPVNKFSTDTSFIGDGTFKYIRIPHEREMLRNGWLAVTVTEKWEYLNKRKDSPFLFSDDPNVDIIGSKMEELGYYGHSGFSFAWTMRQLECIAMDGEAKYIERRNLN